MLGVPMFPFSWRGETRRCFLLFLFTVCFLRQGLSMQPRLILGSWYSSCLFLGHHARQGWILWVNVCVFVSEVHGRCLTSVIVVIIILLILCVYIAGGAGRIFCLHIWLCYIHASSNLWRSEQDIRSIRTGIRSGSRPLRGCWKLNSGALEEQPVLLTSEPSLQPFYLIFEAGPLIETGYLVSSRDLPISVSQLWDCTCMLGFLHEC